MSLLGTQCAAADDSGFSGFGFPGFSVATLVGNIPAKPHHQPLTGSQFAGYVAGMDERQREKAIRKEVLGGNLPGFLRGLIPVQLKYQPAIGEALTATIFVMPEYLAIGSNTDFLRIPMNLYTAASVASRMGFILPTRKIVDAIYQQAAFHLTPSPMTAGPEMRSTAYYRAHNAKIEEQERALGVKPGALVSGDKKDVVVAGVLANHPGKIAIYGWHRLNGEPIQPLSTVHGACYADYSHGIRLVSETAIVNGKTTSVYDVLSDPELSKILSDEGPIPHLRDFMTHAADGGCGPV